jgi:hypothetical protein
MQVELINIIEKFKKDILELNVSLTKSVKRYCIRLFICIDLKLVLLKPNYSQ